MYFHCYYCQYTGDAEDCVQHCIAEHPDDILKLKKKELNSGTGVIGLRTLNFHVIPSILHQTNKTICPVIENGKISLKILKEIDVDVGISNLSLQDTPSKSPVTKKFRTSTPCHDNDQDSADEILYAQCAEISEKECNETDYDDYIQEINSCLPEVIQAMCLCGQIENWMTFHRLLASNKFPLENIAFHLFMDVCKFYGSETVHSMRYDPIVKKFWRIGYCLFHGKFLNFMSGPKNLGDKLLMTDETPVLKPENAKINFAVPSKAIRKSVEIENPKPGVLIDLIEKLSNQEHNEMKTYKLCVDGKKINAGRSPRGGDVDLFGYEKSPTFSERSEQLTHELLVISGVVDKITELEIRQKSEIQIFSQQDKKYIVEMLKTVILYLSQRIQNLRKTMVNKSLMLDKLKKNSGADWRKSKFVFVISAIETDMYDAKATIAELLKCVDELGYIIASANDKAHLYVQDKFVNLENQENYIDLNGEIEVDSFRCCKQGSQKWLEVRKTALVTGSTLFKAIGQGTLKQEQAHFDKVFFGKEEESPSSIAQERMQYGKDNEINAICTLVCKILPVYSPDMVYVEEGCYKFGIGPENIQIVVSPDGSLRESPEQEACYGVECKCPFPGKQYTTAVYYTMPKYYVTQVMAEMKALNVKQLFFICYSEESTTVFLVKQSEELWQTLEGDIQSIYGGNMPSRPNKKPENCKAVKEQIMQFIDNNVTFLCEFPSVQGINCSLDSQGIFCCHLRDIRKKLNFTVDTCFINKCMRQCETTLKRAYELCRTRATEFLGFMVSDLDRTYNLEMHHAIPVAYGLKGYCLPTSTLRDMVEHVIRVCMEKGLYIPVCCFDGQWYRMAVRDRDDKPLTLLQLQKDVYNLAKRLSKTEIIKIFNELNVVKCDHGLPKSVNITRCGSALVIDNRYKARRIVITPRIKRLINKPENSEKSDSLEQAIDSNVADLIVRSIPEGSHNNVSNDLVEDAIRVASKSMTQSDNSCFELNDNSVPLTDMFSEEETVQDEQHISVAMNIDLEPVQETTEHTNVGPQNTENNLVFLMSLNTDTNINLMMNCLIDKYSGLDEMSLRQILSTGDSINKAFTKKQLSLIMTPLMPILKANRIKCNISQPKYVLVNLMSKIFGDGSCCRQPVRVKKNPSSLVCLCRKAVQKLSKEVLNCVYAQHVYPLHLQQFYDLSSFGRNICISGFENVEPSYWYSRPEFNTVFQNYFFVILDAYHQICGLRRLFCASGIPKRGVSNKPLISVAENSETNNCGLNRAIVCDMIDKQSVAYATQTFSENVEKALRDIHAHKEADFCNMVRHWYQSEDEPGLSAHDRCAKKLKFRNWLLTGIRFDEFPPFGSYINDFPIVLFEGLLTGIERKIQLYPFTKTGTYNTRAIGSLDIENFFSTFQDIDPRGTGVLRPDDIPTAIGVAAELLEARLDPNRGFYMQTAKRRVYPVNVFESDEGSDRVTSHFADKITDLSVIDLSDHEFDKPCRLRGKHYRKSGKVSKHFEPARNPLPVREHHKTNESKILPHVRRGLKLDFKS